jgi:lipid A 3-O-deacylase
MRWLYLAKCRALGAALLVAAAFGMGEALAGPRLVIVEENDALASSRDYGYTQGFRASLVFDQSTADRFDVFNSFLIGPDAAVRRQIEWIIVGQSIFTPKDKRLVPPDPLDRPYAGWLYTGASFAQETARIQLDSFEVLVGVVGPSAGGRQVQNGFHSLHGDSGQALGWEHQLQDEFAGLVAWDRRWKFGYTFENDFGFDFIPSIGVTLGNVFTYAAAGGMIRAGRSLSSTWGPTRVRPSQSGASFFTPTTTGEIGFAVFAGAEGRAVAHNIFLDGNTFVDSPSVDSNAFVADLLVGAEIFSNTGSRLAASVTKRTKEFRTQPGNGDLFGALELSVRF